MDAIMADFEHVAPTAFTDGRSLELDPAKLQPVKDWSTLKALGGDFPKFPPSEYGVPRPSSRQRMRTAQKNEHIVGKIRGMSPAGKVRDAVGSGAGEEAQADASSPLHGMIGYEDSNELEYSDAGEHRRMTRTPASNAHVAGAGAGAGSGWVYSQGWRNRPGIVRTDVAKLSHDNAASAKRLADKRAARPYQMGKHYAASFGKLPALERPRPPSFSVDKAGLERDRLRYILVDVRRARIPGPRYCLDPVRNERSPMVNGRRRVQGSSLQTGFSKSLLGRPKEYPSIDAFANTPSADLGDGGSGMLNSREESAMRASMESLNSGAMWAGRPTSGSIYEAGGNQGGPGPAAYVINDAYCRTSRAYTAERSQFSPINSAPGSPKTAEVEAYQPHGRRNPGRLSPHLSKGFAKH